ncbi:hypothetical protein [Clostridium beijerinckii]|uniref:hypothetical protein n=1 Tax=Clostridium beijerinckii TaxID=1520 RepID=UPI0003D3A44F|nr:hypothetical protein [Clostridium beijerinckii]ALB46904.1 hypothetical protein X276_17495 [Clostridium beijerinckii NRRL B-598]
MGTQRWIANVDNINYTIEYSKNFLRKSLLVNNIPVKLQSSKTFGVTRETTFKLGSKTAILVSIDNNCDIAINGTYLDSGEKYVQVKYMPGWNFIFLGLILLIFILSYDSLCSALFTLAGFYFIIRVSIEPSLNTRQRLLICSFITFSMHLFFWGVLFVLISIL